MFIRPTSQPGLSLLETTIALGILMVGVLASLTLMLSSFNYIQSSENEIVVVNLAREGIEIVRSIRNNNSNPPVGQTPVNIFSGDFDNQSYVVDSDVNTTLSASNTLNLTTAGDISQCVSNTSNDCDLYLTPDGRYTHSPSAGDQPTDFQRLVTITPSPDHLYEKIITSTVSWQIKGRPHTFSLETRLTDWQTE